MNASLDPERWLEEYGDDLYRYALFALGREADAEDAVQDTFLAAVRALETFSGKSSEKTWLFGILKHKIVDRIRQESRYRPLEIADPEDAFDAFFANGKWVHPPSDWGHPEKSLENRQFRAVFSRCLNALPPGLLRVFVLKVLEDRRMDEICRELEISPVNAGVRMHRARLSLRRCLEIHWFEKEGRGRVKRRS
ncbi:sigma-70 family RNA polymerase sigma factor [Leptospirillum ferriphilum]|uniref:sigma-70 family RNA polymerase sigma factor n=1 Tax=Leptospirillum ferriphilum TaxID=178606 RepID=UPI0006B1F6E0|nr:sigma-70 family RNA polymerase sigma factor [Leptospirillum ferriphilum]